MDYAIYKTTDGERVRIIHRFTQADCNHRAKNAAKAKLLEMWQHIICRPLQFRNTDGTKLDEFSYDYPTSASTTERIRFYIAKL